MAWWPSWTFSSKLLSVCISQPIWTCLLSQTQHFLSCNRGPPHSHSIYQITGWPSQEIGPWLQLSSLLARTPGVCQWSNILPGIGQWGLIASSIPQHYSHLNTIASSILGGREQSHWYPEDTDLSDGDWLVLPNLKGILGKCPVQKHLFLRSNLFYRFSHHITLLPFWKWWKEGGAFLWGCAPLVCSLTFPHIMAEASLMHCLLVPSSLAP